MVQKLVKEEEVEEMTVEPVISPAGEVEEVAEIAGLDWSPLANEKFEIMGEDLINEIMSRIPGLMVSTSPNQHQKISFGEGRGRVVCKFWYAKTKVCVETPILEGRRYVVGNSRYLNEKTGLSKKDRAAVVKEIKAYIKARGWTS